MSPESRRRSSEVIEDSVEHQVIDVLRVEQRKLESLLEKLSAFRDRMVRECDMLFEEV